jgi:hypothetical protein
MKVKTVALSDGTQMTARQIMERKNCCYSHAHTCMLAFMSGGVTEEKLLSKSVKRLIKNVNLSDGTIYTVSDIRRIKNCGHASAIVVMNRFDAKLITEAKLLEDVKSRQKKETEWDGLGHRPRPGRLALMEPTQFDRMYGM